MTHPVVTIVIPTYNQAPLLHLALRSVIDQTFENWQAVIVNNYSDDETHDVVQSFGESRFELVNFRNHGVIAASRNKGVELATGAWIAFLDSDDLWLPEKLERCVGVMSEAVDLISHREATFQGERDISVSPARQPRDADFRNLLFKGNCFSPSALLVRKSMLEKVNGFSVEPELITVEDYDLWLRLAENGARVQFVDDVLSRYRLHSGNNTAAVQRHMNASLYAVERHFANLHPRGLFDRILVRRRFASIIYGAGRGYQKVGNSVNAKRCFLRAFRIFPFYAKICAGIALSCLPVSAKESEERAADLTIEIPKERM